MQQQEYYDQMPYDRQYENQDMYDQYATDPNAQYAEQQHYEDNSYQQEPQKQTEEEKDTVLEENQT